MKNTSPEISTLSMAEKYLEALRKIGTWTTVSDWAIEFGQMFPDLLDKANAEAKNHKKPSTGVREIAARISSHVSTGKYAGQIEIDESERPKRVKILSDEAATNYVEKEIEDDLEPLTRTQKIKFDESNLSLKDKYRINEMEAIISLLRSFFGLDFEFEHARAILNPTEPGNHHPDNIQILLKSHNRSKGNSNWDRFSLDEQIEYIEAVVRVQKIVSKRMKIEIEEDILMSVIDRLKKVY